MLELLQRVLGHGQRQPRFADAGRADQGEQPCAVAEQPLAHRGDVVAAAQQGCQLGGQVVGALRTQQARPRREVILCAARPRDQAGQVGLGGAQRPGQGRANGRRLSCCSSVSSSLKGQEAPAINHSTGFSLRC